MSSKADLRKSQIDLIKEQKQEKKKTYGVLRQIHSGISTANSTDTGISSAGQPIENTQGFLKTSGDTMVGPFATYPADVTISGGIIDIGSDTSDYSSNIIVFGQGGAADELDTIVGAAFAGQWLLFQAVATTPITLKHLTGNIRIPSGNDYTVGGQENVLLKYDFISSQWVVVANFNDISGGGGFTNPATEALLMRTFSVFLDADDNSGFVSTTDDQILTKIGGVTRVTTDGVDMVVNLNIIPGSPTGTVDLGATGINEQWNTGHINKIQFNNNTTFSSSIPAIGTESSEIVINAPTGQTIHARVGGGDTFEITSSALQMQLGHNIVLLDADNNATITKLFGFPLELRALDGIDLAGGDVEVTDGDLLVDNGASTDFVMKYGAGSTDHIIRSNTGGFELQVGSGDDFEFKASGVTVTEISDLGIGIQDGLYLQPRTIGNDVIGIVPFRDSSVMGSIGSRGMILIPRQTTSTQPPSTSNLDSWFGDGDDAIGSVSDFTESTGSGRHRLWIKGSGEWRGVELSITPS